MRHYLSIRDFTAAETRAVLDRATRLKRERGSTGYRPLEGETWALLFTKSSTRTRISFEVGLRELGAQVLFLSPADIQLGRGEPLKDTARVMGRMLHGAVIRTFAHADVQEFARESGIITVNALTDDEHPCQILADIFTIEERLGSVAGRTVAFIGDGACNVPRSWCLAAGLLGFQLVVAAPRGYQPAETHRNVRVTESVEDAVRGADVLYTDVWVSMGMESEKEKRLQDLGAYRIDASVVALAKPGALVMHCLPAYRGWEIEDDVFEANARTIFDEAENRLHVQKAIVSFLRAARG
jgi:ornithine carbamoyltransferase